jgi:LacI family transcriptional regulator
VAVLVETDDTWGHDVVEATARHARQAGWALLIGPRDRQRRLRLPLRWRGDGVIASIRDLSMARHLRHAGVPTVDVSLMFPEERWAAQVSTDDARRAEVAFEHFRSRGLRSFGCYSPPIGRYPDHRGQEFARVTASAGFACSMFTPPRSRQSSGWLADYERASQWLAKLEKPVAIFASDAYPARQLAEVCQRDGVRIPDEVAILAGDNDDLLCNVAWPPLSSVLLASHRIGREACSLLEQLMSGSPPPAEPVLIPPVRVIERLSTAVVGIADEELIPILQAIRDRATQGLSVNDLLEEFPISRRGLELRCRREIGRTPAEEIRRVRIERARQLLTETDQSIDSIAHAVGLSSGPVLSHLFRKHEGITPGELRSGASRGG